MGTIVPITAWRLDHSWRIRAFTLDTARRFRLKLTAPDTDWQAAAPRTTLNRKILASYFGSGWAALMGLAFVPLYVRYLGIESYGLIGLFATLQVWLSVLDMGLSATLSREMALFAGGSRPAQSVRDLLRSLEVIYGVTACILAALMAALSAFVAEHWLNANSLPSQTIATSILLMGLMVAAQWMGTLYRGGLLGLQHQVWLSGVTAIGATARAAGSVFVLAWSPTITAFFVFQAVVSAVETLVLGGRLHAGLPGSALGSRFSTSSVSQVWRFAGGLTIISLLATLLTQLDKLLLSKLLPLEQFGYFMLMVTVAGAISVFVVPLHNVAYPRFAELAGSGKDEALIDEYHKFSQILSIGVLPVALMLMFFPGEIILLWTGDAAITRAVAPLLSVWVLGTALNSFTHIPHMAQVATGWTRLGVVMSALMVASSAPLLVLLVPRFGAISAAWIWVGVNAAYLLFAVPVMHSRMLQGEKWNWYLRDLLVPLIAGVGVSAALRTVIARTAPCLAAYLLLAGVLVFLAVSMSTRLGRQTASSLARKLFCR